MFVYVFNAPTYHKDKAPRRKQKKNITQFVTKIQITKKYKPQSKSEEKWKFGKQTKKIFPYINVVMIKKWKESFFVLWKNK